MIFGRPKLPVLSAINRLNATEDFQLVLEHLRSELKQADEQNRHLADVVKLHQSQGIALALAEIIKTCDTVLTTIALQGR